MLGLGRVQAPQRPAGMSVSERWGLSSVNFDGQVGKIPTEVEIQIEV